MMKLLLVSLLFGYARPELLVESDWLHEHLNAPEIRIIDARARGYVESHIPGAVPFDTKETRDPKNPPTFLPAKEDFEQQMKKLGVTDKTLVIAYDDRGGVSAARLWWILNYYGHSRAALLNGGWIKWAKEGKPVTGDVPQPELGNFQAKPNPDWLALAGDVQAGIGKEGIKIVDARTLAEHEGLETAGVKRMGRVPSSILTFWEDTLDPEGKTIKPSVELEKLFKDRGIQQSDQVITYCQTGYRASLDLFVLRLLGFTRTRLYLGSWEEWGNREDLPVETGKPK